MENKTVPAVDEMLPTGRLFVLGLQHVMAMYAGAVAVPIIIANSLGLSNEELIYLINADLLVGGIATIIQALGVWKLGIRSPIMQGVSFAAVTPMVMVGAQHGLRGIFGATIAAGVIGFIISPYFSRLIRFFPPVVTGTIITLIGVSLLPVAVRWAGGGNTADPNFGNLQAVGLAFAVLLFVILVFRFFTGFFQSIAVLLGLIVGTIVAIPLGMTNFSQVATASWFGLILPFNFGLPIFDLASILAMTLAMLVIMTETTGDMIAVGEIVEKPVDREGLTRGLRADCFSTILGGVMNTFPHSAFAQNVGLLALTGIRSRFVVVAAGIILGALGLFPKAAAVVAAIPQPVLGGAGIALFGMVAASGIRTLSKVKFDGNNNSMIVAISLGLGLIPLAAPDFYHYMPDWAQLILHSGITAGSIAAIILNYFFNETGKKDEDAGESGERVDGELGFEH
ncbi:nucleobase:cation symporter-2 family protein [Peptococcaceae bacterium 1198_IL3148]